jgi:HSP20 family molecular chaperone IbpA
MYSILPLRFPSWNYDLWDNDDDEEEQHGGWRNVSGMELTRAGNHYRVIAYLEGENMPRDAKFRVEVKDGVLRVSGEHRRTRRRGNGDYGSESNSVNDFTRSIKLPEDANPDPDKIRWRRRNNGDIEVLVERKRPQLPPPQQQQALEAKDDPMEVDHEEKQVSRRSYPFGSSLFPFQFPSWDLDVWDGGWQDLSGLQLSENDNAYTVVANLGAESVPKDANIKVKITNGVLNVSADHRDHRKRSDKDYHFESKSYSGFSRSIRLPEDANHNNDRIRWERKPNGDIEIVVEKKMLKAPPQAQAQAQPKAQDQAKPQAEAKADQ